MHICLHLIDISIIHCLTVLTKIINDLFKQILFLYSSSK